MTVILMYHALYSNDAELARIDAEDRPYAVSTDDFREQLAALQGVATGLPAVHQSNPEVVVTFDDGHVSNYDIALPLLAECQIQAYFFITSDFIGTRPHFCSRTQLRELHTAGMIVGSHGKTHGFFADMEKHEADHEFRVSRDVLSEMIGDPVESISFPGGRYENNQLELARMAGYQQIFGSGFGLVDFAKQTDAVAMNRIPIRGSTGIDEFNKIITNDRSYYLKEGAKHKCKSILKRTLGNQRYHALYKYAAERR